MVPRRSALGSKRSGVALERYREKRDFSRTTEPAGGTPSSAEEGLRYVIQKHAASRLHYDLRLELDGVMLSWAVPKGPSLDTHDKRLAVRVEDHPIDYAGFEGVIPKGEYGAGTVIVWDRGTWHPVADPHAGLAKGDLKFVLAGEKLGGLWVLVRMKPRPNERSENWLLIKERDELVRPGDGDALLREAPASVASGRTVEEVAAAPGVTWHSEGPDAGRAIADPVAAPPDPAVVTGAVRASMPHTLELELATAVTAPPEGDGWLHEVKYDGYRALCRIEGGAVRMLSRNGHDWTERFASVAEAAGALPVSDALLDGEVVVMRPDGVSDFGELQAELSSKRGDRLAYVAFDLPYLGGFDLTAAPLHARKAALTALLATLPPDSRIRLADHLEGGGSFLEQACELHLEGVVSKRRDSPYRPGRGRDWLKTKCLSRQEFVVGGWTDPTGARISFGALLLGTYRDGRLTFVGRVGTGFDDRSLHDIAALLAPLARDASPFADVLPAAERRGVHWVAPELVAEVAYAEMTREGHLRHASFKGLREDKPAAEVVAEHPADPPSSVARTDVETILGVRVTHPDKLLYPADGITKRELASHYERVATRMLPHLRDRPLAMLRCPQGLAGACFFHKHAEGTAPAALRRLSIVESAGPGSYLAADSLPALVALVQMDVLEVHTWGCRAADIEHPDRLVFDLDPDESVTWPRLVEAARLVRQLLDGLGLTSFAKLTGGKGIHVVAPLAPERGWAGVSRFARAVAEGIVSVAPERYTANMRKDARAGKVFVDYLRNARGATAVEVYSTRAKSGGTVAVPVRWDELARLRSDAYTVRTIGRRLSALKADPWEGYDDAARPITDAMLREIGAG
jgi:bifunctional non-homologous end joining protein LigD